ncbi:SPFH domain-containing protein [Flavobacterium sp. RHBU_24]|uniref:SPFH domain-containing protein n=1 Tax=Flavobacterium sp. RHBU_24 TaxID=3391185 RepID=UPI003984E3F6
MGIFDIFRGNDGGFIDVIRCDEDDFLVHKWTPGDGEGSSKKEYAIRYGSRLVLRPGEGAVFFYPGGDANAVDILYGPANKGIETGNFPVLSGIVGSLFGGESPFTAEVYFFNFERNIQIRFGIPYFDVFDARFPDLGVPCAVRGTLTFTIADITNFIKQYRLQDFSLPELELKIRDFYTRKAKAAVLGILTKAQISVMQAETKLEEISDYILAEVKPELEDNFGIALRRIDITALELDKTSIAYTQLKSATADLQTRIVGVKTEVEITNLTELARIQRKDIEMGVEGKNFAVHQVNLKADVLKTAAGNLGEMSEVEGGRGRGGFSAAGVITGMALGGAMANQMGGMMGSMDSTPPPPPAVTYFIAINGQQSGPYTVAQLKEFALSGQFTGEHYIWKQGMAGWEPATDNPAMAEVFGQAPPPPPAPTK